MAYLTPGSLLILFELQFSKSREVKVCILWSQVTDYVSAKGIGVSFIVPTLDIVAWHVVQLVPPASEPARSALLCLRWSILISLSGYGGSFEPRFTSFPTFAAVCFPSLCERLGRHQDIHTDVFLWSWYLG